MMLRILFILTITLSTFASSSELETKFKDDRKSLIKWDELKAQKWLDFDEWKEELRFKESYPLWRDLEKISGIDEEIGRVIKCVGECTLFRKLGNNKIGFRSLIKENDDIETGIDSYLWLMLFDGTLIRIAPESSISLKEMNILKDEVFFNIRMNVGNVLLISRSKEKLKELDQRDTDSVFFPLPINKTNPVVFDKDVSMNEYLFEDGLRYKSRTRFINEAIEKNNKNVIRKSRFFIQSPLYSFEAYSPSFETYVSIGDDSYLKFRDDEQLGYKNDLASSPKVNLRGYENDSFEELEYGSWYKFSFINRNVFVTKDSEVLSQNELFTKRIYGIYYTREIFLERYGKPLFAEGDEVQLAKNYGLRLWKKEELEKRLKFLWTHVREVETTNLAIADRYRKSVLNRANRRDKDVLRKDFYTKAQESYYKIGAMENSRSYFPKLNSEKQELWKKLNGIYTEIYPGLRESTSKGTTILDESSDSN
ncbi:hypothetical protein ABMA70_12660 [Halobacteriovorax sp. XZX-3]|uniref:hypothetical protein n=1 Tax=unclassified Halobacteriovorax TaxID=2639665 RepID=UPI00371192ED